MSYAEVTSHNAHQSAEEARAPAMPEVQRSDDSVNSLIDVDSPHISSVPSDFDSQSVKTDTQAERIEQEAQEAARQAEAKSKALKKELAADKEKAKKKAKAEAQWMKENSDNPVFVGNAVISAVVLGVVGYNAYQKYAEGQMSWKAVGLYSGIVGAFATADYFISSWLFKKYPPKK